MFFRNTIKSRVMKIINDRIAVAQEKHDEAVTELEETATLSKKMIDDNLALEIEKSADALASSIIGPNTTL